MAVRPVFKNNSYVESGETGYAELQADARSDIPLYPTTGYAIGTEIFCTEDWSIWKLGYKNSVLQWLEVEV